MASQQDFNKQYNQAFVAYGQGQYEDAATLLERLASDFPDNPQICLLQAHLYYVAEQYLLAQQNYERVIILAPGHSQSEELVNCAQEGIERTQEVLPCLKTEPSAIIDLEAMNPLDFMEQKTEDRDFRPENSLNPLADQSSEENGIHWSQSQGNFAWPSPAFLEEDSGDPTLGQRQSLDPSSIDSEHGFEEFVDDGGSTFGWSPHPDETSPKTFARSSPENRPFDPSVKGEESTFGWSPHSDEASSNTFTLSSSDDHPLEESSERGDATFGWPSNLNLDETSPDTFALSPAQADVFFGSPEPGEPTFMISSEGNIPLPVVSSEADNPLSETPELNPSDISHNLGQAVKLDQNPNTSPQQQPPSSLPSHHSLFEELDRISESEASGTSSDWADSPFFSTDDPDLNTGTDFPIASQLNLGIPTSGEETSLIAKSRTWVTPTVDVKQGAFAWLQNAPLNRKKWYLAVSVGVGSALSVLIVGGGMTLLTPNPVPTVPASGNKMTSPSNLQPKDKKKTIASPAPSSVPDLGSILPMALTSGLSGFVICLLLIHLALHQTKRSVQELMAQFDAIRGGNFNVRAMIFSGDELGALNADFNHLSLTILNQVQNALLRAEEMEKARDNLQRQVIRLLDNVEGAARGDLTVEAEVTADVLGTVADAFNLTIKNLRDIVSQVKKAAHQVNQGSTDSELFARKNSSDAKGMAEEVAVTLNSIHLMSESVQRVAENAKEAEEVALSSSVTALKGGEAVERTVAGILQIRETVSETARKVKRLAEASQEISKIVALISQIASRTNLLALNASIQAARAGESGRGFAVVAGEVRQLADRSAKSLKEIEQIVLQIQGETGSVMTAMEEGIQQVIDVTDKSEQAKRSLEDIIAVSNHINTLVRSISSDTVKQQETALAVAQVMQWVDVTAQGTAQESQQVAGSLQNLVAISRALLTSVERFQVDKKVKK